MMDSWGAIEAGRVPLFERLVDEQPQRRQEATPLRSYTRDELLASVRRELALLLATRCPLSGDAALARARTVIDYGLPDLELGGRATIREDRLRAARLIRQVIEAYEPRLQRVEVEVLERADGGARLAGDAWRGFCRGTEVTLTLDEELFVGSSPLLFASVLSRFLSLYAHLNTFTELVLKSTASDEVWTRWPPTAGAKTLL
jgi:type VI secretion system lysozyme-like protein